MPDLATLETRVATLEAEVAALKRELAVGGQPNSWVDAVAGSFRNEPDFDEVLRLGRQIRNADRPGAAE